MTHADRTRAAGRVSDLGGYLSLKAEGRRFDPAPDHQIRQQP
jgi:hypothetical protein